MDNISVRTLTHRWESEVSGQKMTRGQETIEKQRTGSESHGQPLPNIDKESTSRSHLTETMLIRRRHHSIDVARCPHLDVDGGT